MRLSEGRTLAFFPDSTFPPPVQICEETSSDRGGGGGAEVCRENREGDL